VVMRPHARERTLVGGRRDDRAWHPHGARSSSDDPPFLAERFGQAGDTCCGVTRPGRSSGQGRPGAQIDRHAGDPQPLRHLVGLPGAARGHRRRSTRDTVKACHLRPDCGVTIWMRGRIASSGNAPEHRLVASFNLLPTGVHRRGRRWGRSARPTVGLAPDQLLALGQPIETVGKLLFSLRDPRCGARADRSHSLS
jgi:hypothetical protein